MLPSVETVINSEGALAVVIHNWWPDAQSLHERIMTGIPWLTVKKDYYGKEITIPRQVCLIADKHIKSYSHPYRDYPANSWDDSNNSIYNEIRDIRDHIRNDLWIKQMVGIELEFDSCLANNYAKPTDHIAYHPDREALGPLNAVVTLSLGGSIPFIFKSKQKGPNGRYPRREVMLHSGDLTFMAGRCQELWTHGIEADKTGQRLPRESLTYRCINNSHGK